MTSDIAIAVIGLGYVGLPLAVEFGKLRSVIEFDINSTRVTELKADLDHTLECCTEEISLVCSLSYSDNPQDLRKARISIVTVPIPVGHAKRSDMIPLVQASETAGMALKQGGIVIYESTVYPGAIEKVCVRVLEEISSLRFNTDFLCGYCSERINSGDKKTSLALHQKSYQWQHIGCGRAGGPSLPPDHHCGHAQGQLNPRGCSRQSDRKNAARRQHCATERTELDISYPGYRYASGRLEKPLIMSDFGKILAS
jgi:hypothetical protein